MNVVLEAKNITKEFFQGNERTLTIKDVSFQVREGEFVSIIGSSGCGKTTLLRILAGLWDSSGGSVFKKGRTNLIFQDYAGSLFSWKTVRENVEFGRKRNPEQNNLPIEDYLRMVGIEGFADHFPCALSGGMQQRVALARSMAYDPDIILMDEPFGSLDTQTKADLEIELLRIWKESQKTIIFVTHDIEEALYLSDRVIVLGHRPAGVERDLLISIPRPRDFLTVKERRDFIDYKHEIYKLLQK
jgi:NitT/TauT family transport system ATP-binding protein